MPCSHSQTRQDRTRLDNKDIQTKTKTTKTKQKQKQWRRRRAKIKMRRWQNSSNSEVFQMYLSSFVFQILSLPLLSLVSLSHHHAYPFVSLPLFSSDAFLFWPHLSSLLRLICGLSLVSSSSFLWIASCVFALVSASCLAIVLSCLWSDLLARCLLCLLAWFEGKKTPTPLSVPTHPLPC